MLVGTNRNKRKSLKAAEASGIEVRDTIFKKGSPEYQEMFNLMMDGTIKMHIRPGLIREAFLHWKNKHTPDDFRVAYTRVRKDAMVEMKQRGMSK